MRTELRLGDLSRVLLSVAAEPMFTLLSVTADALGGPRQGVPRNWLSLVRAELPAGWPTVRPVFARPVTVLPDCLCPPAGRELAVPIQLDRIAAVPADRLAAEVSAMFGDPPPPGWRPVLRHPGPWLRRYAGVLAAVWRAYRPIWRRLAASRSAEVERVGAAAVTGTLDLLLAGLGTRTRYSCGTLHLPYPDGGRIELGGRRLVLSPLVSGPRAGVCNLDLPDAVWLGYPLPTIGESGCAAAAAGFPAPPDALTTLLGPVRASLLRTLHRPSTMGTLARRLNTAPSTVTYHCGQLAAAGLVLRRRDGREVRVTRTPRGDAVVDLLS